MLFVEEKEGFVSKMIDAQELTLALLSDTRLSSGVLPDGTIFWNFGGARPKVGLWRRPQIWKAALQLEAFKAPRRFTLPMPGLVFICEPGMPPAVYAAKRRPVHNKDMLYHAPVFNLSVAGHSCPGTHKYPNKVSQIPEAFFLSFFTNDYHTEGRSKKHPKNLVALWEDLNGKRKYPMDDLIELCTLEEAMK